MGADDYLPKPFHLSELSARIAAIIRRRNFEGNKLLVFEEITIDTVGKVASVDQVGLDLTRTEYDLLLYLVTNKNRVVSKNAIAEHLSADEADIFDSYDFIYAHLKTYEKLVQAGCTDYIKNVYGMGYKFSI